MERQRLIAKSHVKPNVAGWQKCRRAANAPLMADRFSYAECLFRLPNHVNKIRQPENRNTKRLVAKSRVKPNAASWQKYQRATNAL